MTIISAKSDAKFEILRSKIMTKSLKILKMSLFLGFLKYKLKVSEEKLLKYMKLNKDKIQNVWIDRYKVHLKETRDTIIQKCMIKKEIKVMIKKIKTKNYIKEAKIMSLYFRLLRIIFCFPNIFFDIL